MSLITDMFIFTAFDEVQAMVRLNQWCWLHDEQRHQQFALLDSESAGGTKALTCEVWAMAGNYFPYEKLVDAFSTFEWRAPGEVVLIVSPEGMTTFIVRPGEPLPDLTPALF